MTPRIIIGLAGRAGAGKDSVANALIELAMDEFSHCVRLAFGSRIKAGLKAMLDVDTDQMTREQKEAPVEHLDELGEITARYLLQTLGTEWGRAIHPDLWVHMLGLDIHGMWAPAMFITDCRFPNEVEAIHRLGGVVWWVERDGLAPVRAHASEGAIGPMDCDRTIANLGTLDDLDAEVERAWEQHLAQREAA